MNREDPFLFSTGSMQRLKTEGVRDPVSEEGEQRL